MKNPTLHLKDGMSFRATATEGQYIAVFEEDGKLLYSVFSGGKHTEKMLLLPDGISELPIYMTCHAVEIYQNFHQYYAMLSQIP